MAKRLSFVAAALLVDQAWTAQTIEEQWGDLAVPKNCFEVLPSYGSIKNGQQISDFPQLQDTKKMSFSHRITGFKRCFPYNSSEKLISLALYLSVYDEELGE